MISNNKYIDNIESSEERVARLRLGKVLTSFKGDLSEYRASIWLAEQGYDVFRNMICTGPVDLIALDRFTGETILVDVKSSSYDPPVKASHHWNNLDQEALGVRYLCVHLDGECSWAIMK
jgi:hypothetical protein